MPSAYNRPKPRPMTFGLPARRWAGCATMPSSTGSGSGGSAPFLRAPRYRPRRSMPTLVCRAPGSVGRARWSWCSARRGAWPPLPSPTKGGIWLPRARCNSLAHHRMSHWMSHWAGSGTPRVTRSRARVWRRRRCGNFRHPGIDRSTFPAQTLPKQKRIRVAGYTVGCEETVLLENIEFYCRTLCRMTSVENLTLSLPLFFASSSGAT